MYGLQKTLTSKILLTPKRKIKPDPIFAYSNIVKKNFRFFRIAFCKILVSVHFIEIFDQWDYLFHFQFPTKLEKGRIRLTSSPVKLSKRSS